RPGPLRKFRGPSLTSAGEPGVIVAGMLPEPPAMYASATQPVVPDVVRTGYQVCPSAPTGAAMTGRGVPCGSVARVADAMLASLRSRRRSGATCTAVPLP